MVDTITVYTTHESYHPTYIHPSVTAIALSFEAFHVLASDGK